MNREPVGIPQKTVHGLAVVGFIALIIAGMWLAVYSTRYVPTVVSRIGSAAVYLGSLFVPAPEPTQTTQPGISTTTPSLAELATTTPVVTPPPVIVPPPHYTPPVTAAGTTTRTTYPIGGSGPATYSGLPDLVVAITGIGYLTSTSTDSFVASQTVSVGSRSAVKFTIKNVGTNVSGTWRFRATIPTSSSYLFESAAQQSLAPGESIDYTLGFDQANRGTNQTISVTADFDNLVKESNESNNSASASISVQ